MSGVVNMRADRVTFKLTGERSKMQSKHTTAKLKRKNQPENKQTETNQTKAEQTERSDKKKRSGRR